MMPFLVDPDGLAHSALQIEALDILPVLLEERHKEVDSHLSVDVDIPLRHANMRNAHTHAENLLELELD